jgi:hypothetical protein
MTGSLDENTETSKRSLDSSPRPQIKPPLIVVNGLPGAGKSPFCRKLAEKLPFLIPGSDALRKILFPTPQHNERETSGFSLLVMFSSKIF